MFLKLLNILLLRSMRANFRHLVVTVLFTITTVGYLFLERVYKPLKYMEINDAVQALTAKPYNVKEEQKRRLKRMKDFCSVRFRTPSSLPTKHYLYVRPENRLLYCQIPKVASTNWKKIFLYLKGTIKNYEGHRDDIHRLPLKRVSDLEKENKNFTLRNYFKFLLVRHPFERLVSAYRNKFTENDEYFEKVYGSEILRFSRKGLTESEYQRGKGVTFTEFIQWIIEIRRFDEHWKPTFLLCFPCLLKFDFIGKMETVVEDSRAVLDNVGLNRSLFPADSADGYSISSYQLMLKYFSPFSADTIQKLYNIYKEDFLAYDYHIPKELVK